MVALLTDTGPVMPTRLWTPAGVAVGSIANAQSTSVTWRHNAVDTASITVAVDHPLAAKLGDTQGVNLAVVEYGGVRFCGLAAAVAANSTAVLNEATGRTAPNGTTTVTLVSDWSLITSMLAVPVPTSPISNQSGAIRDNRSGSLELVTKGIIRDNAARVGLPIFVMPVRNGGVGDGPTVSVSARMQPMLDVLKPALTGANWRLTTRTWLPGDPQPVTGSALRVPTVVVDVVATRANPGLIWSAAAGSLLKWSYQLNPAGWDSTIVGGAGEDAARTFAEVVDVNRRAIGGAWRSAESFADARDIQGNDQMPALMQRGADNNADGAPTSAIAVTVRDGAPWKFGTSGTSTYLPGDTATADVYGQRFTNRVTAVTVTEDKNGVAVTPQIGEQQSSATADAQVLKAILRLQASVSLRAGI